jgi:hypothetical protein
MASKSFERKFVQSSTEQGWGERPFASRTECHPHIPVTLYSLSLLVQPSTEQFFIFFSSARW